MRHTAASKRKLSEMRKGSRNPFYGKKHTPATRKKLAALLRSYSTKRQYAILPQSVIIPETFDLIYLAGIVDGEGSIRFRKRRYPFLAIYNCDKKLKRWIESRTGVDAHWRDYRGRVPGWQWCLGSAADVYAMLTALRPYLVVKRDDAGTALRFLETKHGDMLTKET